MNGVGKQIVFPTVGERSPILNFASRNLRTAYYVTNGLILLAILIVFGYAKYHQWQYQQALKKYGAGAGKKVITLTYAQLGPPPSITGGDEMATGETATRAAAPTVGVPKPVPDAEATQETAPTQAEISGTTMPVLGSGGGTGTTIQVEAIPDINAYVPHEVKPAPILQPKLEYPSAARMLSQEGTVFVKALIDLDGSVMRVVVLKGSGHPMLDTAAVANVYDWKFSPALQQKRPVRVWIAAPIHFKLTQD
jgi:protein TonB